MLLALGVVLLRPALDCQLPAHALAASPSIDALIASAMCSTLPRGNNPLASPPTPRGGGDQPADERRSAAVLCLHAAAGCHPILGAVFWLLIGAAPLCRTIGGRAAHAVGAAPEWCCANQPRGPPAAAA